MTLTSERPLCRATGPRTLLLAISALGVAGCWTTTITAPPREAGAPFDAGGFTFDSGSPPMDAASPGDADAGGDAATACTPSGSPVMHTADVTSDETWASGIHVVPVGLRVTNGAHLTIAPCSEVRLGPSASLTVTTTAAGLDAIGSASDPIDFVALQAGTPWGAINVTSPAKVHLAYATLTGGGTGPHASAPIGGASLTARGTDPARPVALLVEHVTISGSGGLGVALQAAKFDPASTDLTVTGSGWYPVYMGVGSASELPSGTYTGNANDQILLQSFGVAAYDDSAALLSDVTLADHGVPYLVGTTPSSIDVGDTLPTSPKASLTIAAGVTVLFQPQGGGGISQIMVRAQSTGGGAFQPQGALIVQGTVAAPVILDSAGATPAAGDWQGLYFADVVDPRTSITNAHILHAGGSSSAVGICGSTPTALNGAATCAIVMMLDIPPTGFLQNSVLEAAPCGVYRGWHMTDVDFLASNTFVMIPGCTQTTIPMANGSCTACPTSP